MVDPAAVHQACQPLARWWRRYQDGESPDPGRLARAASRAKLLGPVPGPLGEALAYIVEGQPTPADYDKLCAAFTRIADAAGQGKLTLADLGDIAVAADGCDEQQVTQLCLDGITVPTKHQGRGAKFARR
jgi:hypothetical protein